MEEEIQNFDKKGFFFFLKYSFLFVAAFLAVTYGSQYLFDWFFLIGKEGRGVSQEVNLAAVLRQQETNKTLTQNQEKNNILKTRIIQSQKIEDYVPYSGKFIGADLESMEVFLYKDGELEKTLPIVSKGKAGSKWETPSGNYNILTKERNHFSSIGKVYMPYSMQFNGNFFIHGWPYYQNGEDVPLGYSGGCIRLETNDAKEVFDFAEVDTPIFVYDARENNVNGPVYLLMKDIGAPDLNAKSFIVADLNTGEVFAEKNSDEIFPIASLTKLVTAITSNENIYFENKIAVKANPLGIKSRGDLRPGEKITEGDMLYPLLMESSNDVAYSISSSVGEKNFISLMNRKALAIGMENTNFSDSSGISDKNTSTVNDLFALSKYIYDKNQYILGITKTKSKTISASESNFAHTFSNFNIFSSDENFLGGKTGQTTAARETMIAMFKVPIDQEKIKNIVLIVLGSEDRKSDILSLLGWFEKISSKNNLASAVSN